jgi:uncharacterized membrane protein YbhN (UPF0104 family)
LGLLYWIFTFVSLEEIWTALVRAHGGLFLASTLVALAVNGVAALRMRLLTACQGMSVTAPRIFSINLISSFYGMFLPGSLAGGAIRWRKLYLEDRNAAGAFVAMVLNRFMLTTMTIAVGGTYWLVAGRRDTEPLVGLVFLGLLVGTLVLQGAVMLGVAPLEPAGRASAERAGRTLADRMKGVLAALARYRDLPRPALGWAIGLALLEELLGLAAWVLMAVATGVAVPLLTLGWVRSFILLIGLVPISFFGVGVQEGTLIALLAGYGVSGAQAVAFSFLLVTRTVLISLLGGVLEARDVFFPARPARSAVAGGVGGPS